ncbi:MAG TPA: thioredoxin domain-containing protein [Spirochaetota bacterium]|nr:thioredoxin domain-containing protein [Spirochaetota bacterium]HRZ26967.1 thioredoxin domain-containing protein [Spirochaetota bacterium]HSA15832.1 thioredoxin domain-containing protein [Spirochaetota bacterium]
MKTNRLRNEKSPYLLQHAGNPVDWYPWCSEAFEKAKQEDRPVFLSIGYSTCHWCHVMERESFEDEEVARLLNETFVNIKVDREERPDIDAVYMDACRLMMRSGGWPLTIIMTPGREPFFAATYIPKNRRYDRPGLMEIIPRIRELWAERRSDIIQAASDITLALRRDNPGEAKEPGEETLHRAYRSLSANFDETFGGFGDAPKFPSPHNVLFLLRYWNRTGDARALEMAERTIGAMRRGGIYDHLGFGFHRYSTDTEWIVPHFEKMLYDQAMAALACIELFQATGNREYETTAREIFAYVMRDMSDEGGGFYCAEDADSEGVEGKFYLWTQDEIRKILPRDEADLFLSMYRHDSDLSAHGMNEIPAGHFIPHLGPANEGRPALMDALSPIEGARKKLFEARKQRVHPHRDDKILADWNGLMIAALARGAQALGDPELLRAAAAAMDFVTGSMQNGDGRLLHRYRKGEAAIDGNLDDYAFVIWALLELYEATFDARYLVKALEYQSHLYDFFQDAAGGGFFFTAVDAEQLLMRPRELYDGAVPSGNSVAFLNTLRLSRITGDTDERAREIFRAFCPHADASPSAFTYFLCGLDFALGPASEVIIAGQMGRPDTKELIGALRGSYIPNKVVVFRPESGGSRDIDAICPRLQSYSTINGRATVYVCRNFACAQPTSHPKEMMKMLTDGIRGRRLQ